MTELLAQVGIPKRYATLELDGYQPGTASQTEALTAARLLAEGQIDGLALLGQPGLGKSHLLAAACREIALRHSRVYAERRAEYDQAEIAQYPASAAEAGLRYPSVPEVPRWCNVPSLIVDMRSEMSAPEQRHAERARRLRHHAALVVLDDLGRERMSDWTGELVYALVNSRYEQELPTAVASNLTPEELRDSGYWPAISRIAEHGRLIEMQGRDHRLADSSR
jgi:DNA replication protein DnaC